MLTISNRLVTASDKHPVNVDGRKTRKVSMHHMSWSRVHTESAHRAGRGNTSVKYYP